jgi:tetratricopeptide (TPR) repeat protein
MTSIVVRLLAAAACIALAGNAYAAGAGMVEDPKPKGAPGPTAESRYNQGEVLAKQRDWKGAEAAYREATTMKPNFAEAWNGLGHSLKSLQRYDDAVRAYQEALRLRPQFPQAMEYLGEAYVQMGKADEAKKLLEQLKPLDAKQADALARVIEGGDHQKPAW